MRRAGRIGIILGEVAVGLTLARFVAKKRAPKLMGRMTGSAVDRVSPEQMEAVLGGGHGLIETTPTKPRMAPVVAPAPSAVRVT